MDTGEQQASPKPPLSEVETEQIVTDYLLGEYEIEKLRNGFQPPVVGGEPCPDHQAAAGIQEAYE